MKKDEPNLETNSEFVEMFMQLMAKERGDRISLLEAMDLGVLSRDSIAWEDDDFFYVFEAAA